MLRKFTLGLIGAAMIALPATGALAQSQGQPCQGGASRDACVAPHATQDKAKQGKQAGQRQQAGQHQKAEQPGKSGQNKKTAATKAPEQAAPMAKGQKLASGGERLPDPKAYGLKEERGASYYKKDGRVYRVDDETKEILAVIGAVANLLN